MTAHVLRFLAEHGAESGDDVSLSDIIVNLQVPGPLNLLGIGIVCHINFQWLYHIQGLRLKYNLLLQAVYEAPLNLVNDIVLFVNIEAGFI